MQDKRIDKMVSLLHTLCSNLSALSIRIDTVEQRIGGLESQHIDLKQKTEEKLLFL